MAMRTQVDVVNMSRLDDALVRELVQFARDGRDHGHVALSVKNTSSSFRGRAYSHMPTVSNRRSKTRRYLAIAAVGDDASFPLRNTHYPRLKRAPVYDLVDTIEAFVLVVAHELTHCQQFKQRAPASEIHAEESALRTLNRFRQARLEGRLPTLLAHDNAIVEKLVACSGTDVKSVCRSWQVVDL